MMTAMRFCYPPISVVTGLPVAGWPVAKANHKANANRGGVGGTS